jgi:hyperosmotically inducible periplasmic protein
MVTIKHALSSLYLALSLGLPFAVLTGATGCAGDRYQRSTGEYIDDKTLTARVQNALADHPDYKFTDVNVTTYRGVVQLSGFVNTAEHKQRAKAIAERVQGVKSIENNISVK